MAVLLLGAVLIFGISTVNGHGRLLDPPQRSSLWRFYKDINAPKNYDDNELFCGGFEVQRRNDGKCGTCGDPYDGERENEAGGKYAIGFIARTYQEGQRINVTVQLTASHKGYMEFKLCPHNDVHTPVSQECLDDHPLPIIGQTGDPYRYPVGSQNGFYYIDLELPDGVTCSQCVFQWYYKAGNSYNCDKNETCCIGCGLQETFVNCADVRIVEKEVVVSPSPNTNAPTTTSASQATVKPTSPPPATGPPATKPTVQPTSRSTTPSSSSSSPATVPTTSSPSTTKQVTTHAPATTPPITDIDCELDYIPECVGVGIVPPNDLWCTRVCRAGLPDCTPDKCNCTCVKQIICVPVGFYDTLPGMIDWCNANCANGACPDSSVCDCK